MGLVKIYNRLDKSIPYGSDIFIVYDHFNKLFHVHSNIYDITFKKSFDTKDQALRYYHEKKNKLKGGLSMNTTELIKKLSVDDLKFFCTVELPKIEISKVSRFLVNSDIKDFLIEYLWEVGAADHFIKKIEKVSISDRRIYLSYVMIDYDGIYYIVLPSGMVVSWV